MRWLVAPSWRAGRVSVSICRFRPAQWEHIPSFRARRALVETTHQGAMHCCFAFARIGSYTRHLELAPAFTHDARELASRTPLGGPASRTLTVNIPHGANGTRERHSLASDTREQLSSNAQSAGAVGASDAPAGGQRRARKVGLCCRALLCGRLGHPKTSRGFTCLRRGGVVCSARPVNNT